MKFSTIKAIWRFLFGDADEDDCEEEEDSDSSEGGIEGDKYD